MSDGILTGTFGTMAYTIRQATLLDQPELQAMAKRFVEQSVYGQVLTFDPVSVGNLVVTVLQHGIIFIAEHQRRDVDPVQVPPEIVGMLALLAFPHPVAGEPYVDEVAWWVEPAHRRGIGPALLVAAEEWATRSGIGLLKMVAPAGSSVGRFYERHGYQVLETAYVKRLDDRPAGLPVRPTVPGNGEPAS